MTEQLHLFMSLTTGHLYNLTTADQSVSPDRVSIGVSPRKGQALTG